MGREGDVRIQACVSCVSSLLPLPQTLLSLCSLYAKDPGSKNEPLYQACLLLAFQGEGGGGGEEEKGWQPPRPSTPPILPQDHPGMVRRTLSLDPALLASTPVSLAFKVAGGSCL